MKKWIRRYVAVSLVCFLIGVVAMFASLWWCAFTETDPGEVKGWLPNTILALIMPAAVGMTVAFVAILGLSVRDIWTGSTSDYY